MKSASDIPIDVEYKYGWKITFPYQFYQMSSIYTFHFEFNIFRFCFAYFQQIIFGYSIFTFF